MEDPDLVADALRPATGRACRQLSSGAPLLGATSRFAAGRSLSVPPVQSLSALDFPWDWRC